MLTLTAAALAGLFGALAASLGFLVAGRVAAGKSVAVASRCDGCRARLGMVELIPAVGWIARRGRCRLCGVRVSAVYPLVETALALVWAGLTLTVTPGLLAGSALYASWWLLLLLSARRFRRPRPPAGGSGRSMVAAAACGAGLVTLLQALLLQLHQDIGVAVWWAGAGVVLLVTGVVLSSRRVNAPSAPLLDAPSEAPEPEQRVRAARADAVLVARPLGGEPTCS